MESGMSLLERVRQASGGALWDSLSTFRGYVAIKGEAVSALRGIYCLNEIVADGDLAAPSVRMSGFDDAADWCVHPEFVAVRYGDGRFLGSRRRPDGCFSGAANALDEIYLCGLGVWLCMTAPLALRCTDAVFEDMGDWAENGEHWRRLKIAAPSNGAEPALVNTLYFDNDSMMRRADFDSLSHKGAALTLYCSAFQKFSGLTLPTLYRALQRRPDGRLVKHPPSLDIEIFDAAFH
jgi:hypothetical protein